MENELEKFIGYNGYTNGPTIACGRCMPTERPLASLPPAVAEAFLRALFAPGARFARAFHHYWRVVLKQNAPTAALNTRIELVQAVEKLIANLDDPHMHVLCDASDQPIAIFGYRALRAHAIGNELADALERRPISGATGPFGFAHCVGILDAHASVDTLKRIFVSIANKAHAAGHQQLFFFTSDHRLEGLYRRFGMEFPAQLALSGSKHLVGMYDLTRCENRIRLAQVEQLLAAPSEAERAA
jgi:hypothetical protein